MASRSKATQVCDGRITLDRRSGPGSASRPTSPVDFRRAPRGRPLTNRDRRRLHKQTKKTSADRSWCDAFTAKGVKEYSSGWMKTFEPPSPGVEKMLKRCGDRMVRSGRIDLRQLDRRFWEMLFVCGWWPFAADKTYWPAAWQRCRMNLDGERIRQVHTIRDRTNSDALSADTAAAYADTPVVGSLYEWWCSLAPPTREMLMEDSRALYDGKDAFSDTKRRNVRSRHPQ